jgi:hypothetical protein
MHKWKMKEIIVVWLIINIQTQHFIDFYSRYYLALPAGFTKYLPKTWTVYNDEPLELSCQLTKSNVRVIWLKDGITIDDNSQMKNEGLRYSLYVPHGVQPGRYTIRIDDGNGLESSCQVTVEGMISLVHRFLFDIYFFS